MPFQRGRRREDASIKPLAESGPPSAPKMPLFSEFIYIPDSEGRSEKGMVRVHYKDISDLGEAPNENWGLAYHLDETGAHDFDKPPESDPYQTFFKDAHGYRTLHLNKYRYAAHRKPEEAERDAWRAYQHDVGWMQAVETEHARGLMVDDDRYVTDNTAYTAMANDEAQDDNDDDEFYVGDEYVNMDGVWHRLDDE